MRLFCKMRAIDSNRVGQTLDYIVKSFDQNGTFRPRFMSAIRSAYSRRFDFGVA